MSVDDGDVTDGPIVANGEAARDPIADYLVYFGLERDPFDASVSPFFGGANREPLLAQLLHLCQFSASAVAVLGEQGMGKTCLRHALLSRFSADDDVCVVDVPILNSAEDVFGRIVAGFGLDCAPGASRGQSLAAIRHFGQSGEEGSLALLVVENAQNLDDQVLGAMLSLLQGQGEKFRRLHILLFSEPQLAERLDGFGIVDVLIHDLYLEPFSPVDVEEYLRFRLEAAGFTGEFPFDEEDLERFCALSHGVPAALHSPARERLIEIATPAPEARTGWPLTHMAAAVILGTVLLLALFYSPGQSDDADAAGAEQAPAREVSAGGVVVADRKLVTGAAVPESASGEEAGAERSDRPASLPKPLNGIPAKTGFANGAGPGSGGGGTGGAATAPATSLAGALSTGGGKAVDAAGLHAAAAPAAGPADATRPPVESAGDPVALSRYEAEIMKRNKNRFTLQILAAGSRKSVERFIARQTNKSELQFFTTRRKGQDWFVVIAGEYASAESARKAIPQLPLEQRKAGPWPRTLDSVQNDIRSYRGI